MVDVSDDAQISNFSYVDFWRTHGDFRLVGTTSVTLTGYTDNTGSAKVNATLSHQRALEVKILLKKFLISLKDGAVKITVVAGGSSNPVASNATAAGRALNRRVEALF